jgi:hypothetical protein
MSNGLSAGKTKRICGVLIRRTFGITKVSETGDLDGIKDIGSGRLFIVKPYALARYDKQSGQDPKFPLTGGFDVKYGLSSNLILNLAGNTDFADAEVDLQPFSHHSNTDETHSCSACSYWLCVWVATSLKCGA